MYRKKNNNVLIYFYCKNKSSLPQLSAIFVANKYKKLFNTRKNKSLRVFLLEKFI